MTSALHIIASAAPGLAPFETADAIEAVLAALRRLSDRHSAPVLAFAVLPAEVDLLLAGGPEPSVAAADLQRALARAVNPLLGRSGMLLGDTPRVVVLPDDADWLPLAEAIEHRVVAAGLADEPGEWPGCSAHGDSLEWVGQLGAGGRAPRNARRSAAPVDAPAAAPTTVGDIITVADVPTVVQLAQVAPGLTRRDEALEAMLLAQWHLADGGTLAVARRVVAGLSGPTGGGFMVTGLYGAGKSHLLGAVALAAASAEARLTLAAHQPSLRDLRAGLDAAGDRLVVLVPLDEHPPSSALEDVVFGAAQDALRRLTGRDAPLAETSYVLATTRAHLLPTHAPGLDRAAGGDWSALAAVDPAAAAAAAQAYVAEAELPIAFAQSRVERLGRLLELAAEAGRSGVLFVLDELSVFLGAKQHAPLQADASFLQFLGQRGALQPVWTLCALQKQIEDIGDIEHYSLRQIKDRFETRLALTLAATRGVLARRVLARRDEATFQAAVETTLRAWTGGARLADLSAARLAEVYPLHPLTFTCLEACAERFLAQTRSVLEFAVARVRGDGLAPGVIDQPLPALVTPDALWAHFAKDIAQHAELRRYRELVWEWYQRNLPTVVEPDDRPLAERLVALLLVLALAGVERGIKDLAAALLPADGAREERVAALVERLRQRGSFVTVERRPGRFNDVPRIDLDCDVNETIRRRARAMQATLLPGDGRLTAVAVESCVDAAFPLATALHPHAAEVVWRNTTRPVFVALRDLATLSADELTNQAALLAGPELDEAVYLYLAEPQRLDRQTEPFAQALARVPDERWTQSLLAWVPREATEAEWTAWSEDVALELVRGDPTLTAGHPLRSRLDEDAEARRARLAALMARLYGDGYVLARWGSAPVGGGSWRESLERLAGWSLDRLFPAFAAVAPRRHLLTRAVADSLIARFIVPGEVVDSPGGEQAADVEDFAQPLGLTEGEQGHYRLHLAEDSPARALVEYLPDRPVTLTAVERWLAKSPYGLVTDQADLLVAAAVRRGYLEALDDDRRPVALASPLRACVAMVRHAPLLDEAGQQALRPLVRAVFGRELAELGHAQQQTLFERLVAWRAAAEAGVAGLRSAVDRAVAELGHEPLQWRETLDLAERILRLALLVEPALSARDGLARLVVEAGDLNEQAWPEFRRLVSFAESDLDALIEAQRLLRAAELPAGTTLANEREALLARLAAGEAVASANADLPADCGDWRRRYVRAYAQWHAEQHGAERFAPYDAFRTGPHMRVLANLSRLALDAPDSAAAVASSLRAERVKQCRRADLAATLRTRLVCDECGLVLGQSPALRPVSALQAEAERGIAALLAELRQDGHAVPVRDGLRAMPPDDPRRRQAEVLLDAPEPALDMLLAATPFGVIDLINGFLTTRVVAHRSLRTLGSRLAGQRLTKRQAIDGFAQWLDPDGAVEPDGLIEFDD